MYVCQIREVVRLSRSSLYGLLWWLYNRIWSDYKECRITEVLDYQEALSMTHKVTAPHNTVRLWRMSDYWGVRLSRSSQYDILWWLHLRIRSDYEECRITEVFDYQEALSMTYYGDCTSEYGRTMKNVGLLRCWTSAIPLYWTVGRGDTATKADNINKDISRKVSEKVYLISQSNTGFTVEHSWDETQGAILKY